MRWWLMKALKSAPAFGDGSQSPYALNPLAHVAMVVDHVYQTLSLVLALFLPCRLGPLQKKGHAAFIGGIISHVVVNAMIDLFICFLYLCK